MSPFVAVVGHVELVEFLVVDHLPEAGEILPAAEAFVRAAGGGGVAAGVLAELGADVELFCALGDDRIGRMARAQLEERNVRVHAALRERPTRRAMTLLERAGERTIVTIGERLAPTATDPLPWDRLARAAAVYFTAGDLGALHRARQAPLLVATPRAGEMLASGPRLDALVWSAADARERALAERVRDRARLLVATEGAHGGKWWSAVEAQAPSAAAPSFASSVASAAAASENPLDAAAGARLQEDASAAARMQTPAADARMQARAADARMQTAAAAARIKTAAAAEHRRAGSSTGRWQAVTPPGPVHDTYGAGDAFAAALTFALATGAPVADAVARGAEWGARILTRPGAP